MLATALMQHARADTPPVARGRLPPPPLPRVSAPPIPGQQLNPTHIAQGLE